MLKKYAIILAPDSPAGAAAPVAPGAPAAAAQAAPATSPAPLAAAAPPATPEPAGGDVDEFTSYAKEMEAAVNKPPGDKPPAPAKPVEAAPAKPEEAPDVKRMPAQFRQAYEKTKGELDAAKAERTQLQERIKALEGKGKDAETLIKERGDLQKQINDLQGQVRAFKHEASPEFKEKYDAPFKKTESRARGVIEQIEVQNDDGTVRKGAWNDFVELYGRNEFIAAKEAKRLFGEDGAPLAMRYYAELHRIDDDRAGALQEERANFEKKHTEEEANRLANEEQGKALFEKITGDLVQTNPDYRDDPTDKELVSARNKGYQLFDGQTMSFQHTVQKLAHVRQIVAAHFPNKLKIARMQSELAALKAENEKLKAVPGSQGRTGAASANEPEQDEKAWAEEVRKSVGSVS